MMTTQQRLAYSVVRYYYDRVRDEAINVGVIVQTPTGVRVKMGPIDAIRRAYPFIEVDVLARQVRTLESMLEGDRVEVFDYKQNDRVELATSDLRLLTEINNRLPESLALAAPRFAELSAATPPGAQSPAEGLVEYVFRTFVEPPKPAQSESEDEPTTRRAHTVLHRRAQNTIVSAARKAGLRREEFEVEAKVKGRSREWHLDVRIPQAKRYLHHILVLPELEETFHEAAALARIWQDVQPSQQKSELTAVFYSSNGIPKTELKAGEKLLKSDDIRTVYVSELPHYLTELRGQQRLFTKDKE
jgi:hypothetical protein